MSKELSYFEFWPAWLFYLPMKVYAAYLAVRYGGLTTATAANPNIFAGGFVGESKQQILDQVPDSASEYIAEYVCIERVDLQESLRALSDAGIEFPIVAKPDQGERGAGVQVVKDADELAAYIVQFPKTEKLFLQKLYDYPQEVGLFYIRKPSEENGRIFSLTVKHFPEVVGDGKLTLRELILADPRAGKISELYFPRHKEKLDSVIPSGEKFRLSFAGSHCRGAIFKNGAKLITPEMEAAWDGLAKQIPELYFCRFDVRFNNISDLENLENLKIIEINGAGAEATHIWDSETSLREAYSVLMRQYKIMFQIGQENIRRGHKPLPLKELISTISSNSKLKEQFPHTH